MTPLKVADDIFIIFDFWTKARCENMIAKSESIGYRTLAKSVIKPMQGMALIFLHSLPHEGAEVTTGVKYVLRMGYYVRLEDVYRVS